jgi:hypothetical protein
MERILHGLYTFYTHPYVAPLLLWIFMACHEVNFYLYLLYVLSVCWLYGKKGVQATLAVFARTLAVVLSCLNGRLAFVTLKW